MGRLKNTVLIVGEGITEFYYFNSLQDVYGGIQIKADQQKNSSMGELEEKICDGINKGYDYVFCVIDMDNKDREPERSQYAKLRKKFAEPVVRKKQGIRCVVRFFETHRCTELFFLYYFRYTSRDYVSQEDLIRDLNKECDYRKKGDFFIKCRGLHSYFERMGGSIENAVCNADLSVKEKNRGSRNYTFSELGCLMHELVRLGMKKK